MWRPVVGVWRSWAMVCSLKCVSGGKKPLERAGLAAFGEATPP